MSQESGHRRCQGCLPARACRSDHRLELACRLVLVCLSDHQSELAYPLASVCLWDPRLVLAYPSDQSVVAVWVRLAVASAWLELMAAAGAPWWVAG